MECNKEEAFKAMQIAEKKLETSDFIGARKMAQTAHRLFPTLENITQLLTVCEIHCSSQNRLYGSENDWYGILQIEQSADETAIKRQYRKLALLLHPDKNKFSGAEAAFKLVGEAHRLLSDQSKRKLYDMKYGAVKRNIAPKPSRDQSTTMNKQESGTANGYSSAPFSHAPNSYKPSPPQQAFWTCCPFCYMRYQYLKCYLNKILCCQNCGRGFMSHDLDSQPMPPSSQQGHVPQKKVAPETGPSKSAAQKKHGSDKKGQHRSAGVDQAYKDNIATNDFIGTTEKKSKARHRNVEDRQGVKPNSKSEMTGKEKSRSDAASAEKETPKSEKKKRQRKLAETASFTSESSQEVEDDDVLEKDYGQSRDNCQRKSSRNKNHVSYKKYLSDDDDNLQNSKKSRCGESHTNLNEKMKDSTADAAASELNNSSVGNGDVDVHNKNSKCGVPSSVMSDQNDKNSEVDVDTEKEVQILDCADPEFSDFDKDKMKNCFAVNQVWAIYDNIDGMPRFYARIRKVFSPVFKLQITWFEANPDGEHETEWSDAELPIACGRYTLGDTEETVDLPMFSHLVHWPKRGSKRAYFKYPRKGETWALIKDWDIRWSSEPEKHEAFEYEYVEILSDYVEDDGVSVAYMDKVKGFICLFQTTEKLRLKSFKIAPNQLFRFSHQIPSVRMTGKEREGVPKGSFELDPAALPPNFNDNLDINNIKRETDNAAASGRIDPSHDIESPEVEMEEVIILENNEPVRKNNLKSEAPTIARKSPRKLNTTTDNAQVNMPKHNGSKVASQNGVVEKSSVNHINGETNTPEKISKNAVERATGIQRRSRRDLGKKNAG